MKKKGGSGGCLSAPFRALSRACDSACDLYVRGMSRCAHRVPSGVEAVAVGRGFGRSSALMQLRVSSDRRRDVEDLIRAASRQRCVAAEPPGDGAGKKDRRGKAPATVQAAGKKGLCQVPAAVPAPRKKVAGMGTIAEDAPCEFVANGLRSCSTLKAKTPTRRGAAADGLAARASGFGAIKVGSEVFAR